MTSVDQDLLSAEFTTRFGVAPASVQELRAHGSDRKLYRLRDAAGHSAIGVENSDLISLPGELCRENRRNERFADAALAAADTEHFFDA